MKKAFRKAFLSGSVGMLLAGHGAALAASQTDDSRRLPENRRLLEKVMVTAEAPDEGVQWQTDPRLPRQPVPASDGADYLKTIPGFTAVRNGGSNADPVLRGLFGSRLNLLSNAGSMPGACPSRMDNPMSYVAPETFDRLVVIKGPQTVAWGQGASAGTVRFERDMAHLEALGRHGHASAMLGSHGRRDAHLDSRAGFERGYVRVIGSHSEAKDYRAGDGGGRVPSHWHKWSADAVAGWTPDENTVLELSLGRGDGEARYAGRSMDGSAFKRDATTLRLEKTGFDGALQKLQASLYRNQADHVMDNYSLRQPNPRGMMPRPMASQVERLTQGGRAALEWRWPGVELVVGADAFNSSHTRRRAMGRGAYRAVPRMTDALMRNRGVFVEAGREAQAGSRWVAGLRHDRASVFDRRLAAESATAGQRRNRALGSGFVRYEWQGQAGLSGFAGLGQVRRMPDYWELFSPQRGPHGAANAFAGVQPERTTQLDIGLAWRSRALEAWLNAYLGRIDDYILFTYAPGPIGLRTQAGHVEARIRGLEAGVEYRPAEALTLGATLAQAWGENRTARAPLPQMPPLELRMSATWQAGNWSSGLLWRVVEAQTRIAPGQGSVIGRDLGQSPGFATLALNAGVRLSDRWQLSAGIDNLFDRAYSEHLNLSGSADFGYPADPVRILEPGRTLWMKLDFDY